MEAREMKTTEELWLAANGSVDEFRRLVIEDFLREHEGKVFAWANEDGEMTLEYYRQVTGGEVVL